MADVGERELLAIIFTDAVGSSSQTAKDEDKSLSMLMADLDFIRNEAGVRGGTVLKNTGDGLLISFKSAVDAVECALAIQKSFQSRPKDTGFQHKIGVHIGDVIKKDGDIYGAGVNTASRLTDQCRPGGICLSSTLFELTKQKSEIGILRLSEFLLQNTDPPTLAYQSQMLDAKPGGVPSPKHRGYKPALLKKQATLWIAVGVLVIISIPVLFWCRVHPEKENPETGRLYGFQYQPGSARGLKSAEDGSRIVWTLENNTDQSFELRWFDSNGRPKVPDNLKQELSDLGPGKKFPGGDGGAVTSRGSAFGLYERSTQKMAGSFRLVAGDNLNLAIEKEGAQIVMQPRFLRKATAGDSLAQGQLAFSFWRGQGVPQNFQEAAHWAKLSSEQGNILGICVFAALLDQGSGVAHNGIWALQLWQRAADAQEGWAFSRLGDRYLKGYGGVEKNYSTAVKYLQLAAEKRDPEGMVGLGRCYEMGLGVPVDLDRAEDLYRKAAENPDYKEGREALVKLSAKREKK